MRKIVLFISLFFCFFFVQSQSNQDSLKHFYSVQYELMHKAIVRQDSLLNELNTTIKKDSKSWIELNGPWVGAIIIGLLTILANFIINYYLRKVSRDTVVAQIENSKDLAIRQIKSNTITSSRQKWIENLRDTVAEYISLCSIVFLIIHMNKENRNDKLDDYFQKISFLNEKIELYLNPKEEKHNNVIQHVRTLRGLLYDKSTTKEDRDQFMPTIEQLGSITKLVLKEEWDRVKFESL